MNSNIIPKQDEIPEFTKDKMYITHVSYYPSYEEYEYDEITQEVIDDVLKRCSLGTEVYLYLDEYGECDFLDVCSDGEWITVAYCKDDEEYTSFNKDFADSDEMTDLEVGGQSPVEKRYALQDIELVKEAVEYFIYTSKRYPGIDWIKW